MLENCERLLGLEGYSCHTLSDPTRFRAALAEAHPDVLLLDLRMPGADGLTVLAAALADDPALPVIMMTAYATVASAVQAIREGAFDYLTKPFAADQLVVAVSCATLVETLLESDLFGYERGAFTGALASGKPGQFELAQNGTIFLDEVGEP
ncbi:MAG: response regulator, partial [Gemmatimonadetes bacterium]|nr:response regulator [Gemmatimonadota bacterium]